MVSVVLYAWLIFMIVPQLQTATVSRCQLVEALRAQNVIEDELQDWVCMAEAESNLHYDVIGYNQDWSWNHGIFQISDRYWCNNAGRPPGLGCNVTCEELRTRDLTKAIRCAKIIHGIHYFSAWKSYLDNCLKKDSKFKKMDLSICSGGDDMFELQVVTTCELVEAMKKGGVKSYDMPDFACLAMAESNMVFSLIKYNNDKSQSHGLFQINDKYWCTRDGPNGKGCDAACSELRTRDLAKQVECIKIIHKEQQFKAWNSYFVNCYYNKPDISKCGLDPTLFVEEEKKYSRCSLAYVLKPYFPGIKSLGDWVCIAEIESGLDYKAIGYNPDDSRSHGLFQINDRNWCARDGPPGGDCNITCSDLRRENVTHSVNCAKLIHDRLGFQPWTAYDKYCKENPFNMTECFPKGYLHDIATMKIPI